MKMQTQSDPEPVSLWSSTLAAGNLGSRKLVDLDAQMSERSRSNTGTVITVDAGNTA
jgi:hypothetical protein